MKFYSTRNKNLIKPLGYSVLNGLAPDGGLFMPEEFKQFDKSKFGNWKETYFEALTKFTDEDLSADELEEVISSALEIELPLVKISDNIHVLELFHGPTLAFKDFGARLMARLLEKLHAKNSEKSGENITVLVATSGDTGGAVADGFYKVPGVDVIILYPKGKVSPLQEKQLTTLGENIKAFEIDGNFDDCQKLVKTAFADCELNTKLNLTAANSINIARLLAQMLYYIQATHELEQKSLVKDNLVFSIPSGNFGNLTAGLFAKKMGLNIKKFIASTNSNDVVPKYLQTGKYLPKASLKTISNAMDVGAPSNFERLEELFESNLESFQAEIEGYGFKDQETKDKISSLYKETSYVICPHGAVALLGAEEYLKNNPQDQVVVLGTAHPAKFIEVVEDVLGFKPEIPERLACLIEKEKVSKACPKDFDSFKSLLLEDN